MTAIAAALEARRISAPLPELPPPPENRPLEPLPTRPRSNARRMRLELPALAESRARGAAIGTRKHADRPRCCGTIPETGAACRTPLGSSDGTNLCGSCRARARCFFIHKHPAPPYCAKPLTAPRLGRGS